MWTHWVDPHAEYVPHKEFDYGKEARQLYDGEVSFVEAQIGRVLAALEQHSLNESTVILVSSDHGEAFSEHGMIRHGFEVWEELVRVPLILHVPGATPRRIAERRSLIDTVATILQTFEIETPRQGSAFVRGQSLLTDALQEESVSPEARSILVDMPQGPHNQERRAFYSGDYKLITSRGRSLGLYNLKADPGETKDLTGDEAQLAPIQEEMKSYLDTLHQIPPRR
jgi:arylsulfatase A-like enzyme